MKAKITPLSRRAKNRVKEHGEIMTVKNFDTRGGKQHILVESMEDTWTLKKGVRQHWVGWFDSDEAAWEIFDE